jgi:pantoate--beta-alanine ligase
MAKKKRQKSDGGIGRARTKQSSTPASKKKARRRPAPPRRSEPDEARALVVVDDPAAMQGRALAERGRGKTIAFVPTMGALHAGHAALLAEARRRADVVVCSIFVNPKQFGPNEDLARYPRPFEADRRLCDACGVDVVFAPRPDAMYPAGFETEVRGGALSGILDGAVRPGHFDGVLTVVALLFSIVQPHCALFGEKDFQQLTLIRRMVGDLRWPVEIVPMPVVRDVDGLALSSRNAYLGADDRRKATCLYRALMAAQDEVQHGVDDVARIQGAARAVLDATPGFSCDYVEIRDPLTLAPLSRLDRDARLLLAGRLGGVRLIDNGPLFHTVRYTSASSATA